MKVKQFAKNHRKFLIGPQDKLNIKLKTFMTMIYCV